MLKRKQKKQGWFIGRGYRHFDHPLSFAAAQKLVTSPQKVADHSFRPLLSYQKLERRFKGFKSDGSANVKHKGRLICYASHRDAQIYAFYAQKLEERYAVLRKELGIDDCVLAYRSGKGCNIHMADAAFEEIKKRDSCSVLALDISGFFDNIAHANLKKQWCRVLGVKVLPEDHYNIFKAVTRFSRVDQEKCLVALSLTQKQMKKSTAPMCDDKTFHEKVCGRLAGYESLIETNSAGRNKDGSVQWKSYGIPQGTPISALLSNISMIDFDFHMQNLAQKMGGNYWRYSDDIFFICSQDQEDFIEAEVSKKISEQGKTLKINPGKTEITRFHRVDDSSFECQMKKKDGLWAAGAVQYLGLRFDGKKKTLRHSTIARYQRKRKYAVRNARRTAQFFKKDKIRSKRLYLDLTDIGPQSMPSYAKRASKITGDTAIAKQLSMHKRELTKLVLDENEKIKK